MFALPFNQGFTKCWRPGLRHTLCDAQPFGYIKSLIGGKEPAEADAEGPAAATEKKQDE